MDVTRLLIGCALAMGGAGTATAMNVAATQDLAASPHASVDTATGHEGGGALETTPAHDSSVPGSGDSTGGNDAGSPGGGVRPQAGHRTSLGWQSLLPGSIQ